ncbi:aminoglycoside phosphotransferase (APT) family kinase protein [Paenibacillus rhizosphaerae]|uniref:Aminoglycoside phosphotransferase (APT) family kinase protein n=1 Tax=Paenibacillus rhizosphaerae TaxID=297318 RepID=A0A839TLV4_9BACL|nr:aminoglycoside phosphotransferase family protein [Paenibacillus rhizosphaerae]MBB3127844.1 aminoglycoside phosphotransferase (APT) family kinase protein [Paenibacillus rhizosphaerae]
MYKFTTVLSMYYGLEQVEVFPQKGGWAALAYKVTDTESRRSYFLKVYEKDRASTPKWTARIDQYVPVTSWLERSTGLQGKMPVPIMTTQGYYRCEDDYGIYLLYDYIDGETIGDKPLTPEQICQLSAIVAELHGCGKEIPVQSGNIVENFELPFALSLKDILTARGTDLPGDMKDLLGPYNKALNRMIFKADELSAMLKQSSLPLALCHTDIHPWNFMQPQGRPQLMLIDWEGLKLAPVEADLMFVVDQPYFKQFMHIYRQFHPDFTLNGKSLLFYQIRRKLEDVWEFIEQLLFDRQSPSERSSTHQSLEKELLGIKSSYDY